MEKGEEEDGEETEAMDDDDEAPFTADVTADVGDSGEAREEGERAADVRGERGGTTTEGGEDDTEAAEDGRELDAELAECAVEDTRFRCRASASVTIVILQPTQYVSPSLLLTSAVWQMGHVEASNVQPATTRADKSPTIRLLRSRGVSFGGGGEELYVDMRREQAEEHNGLQCK